MYTPKKALQVSLPDIEGSPQTKYICVVVYNVQG